MTSPARVVDSHSHLYPLAYLERLEARDRIPRIVSRDGARHVRFFPHEDGAGGTGGRPIDESYSDVGSKLAFMRAAGIQQSIVSLGNPWLDPFEGDEAVALARTVNAELAALEHQTGARAVGLGVLPQHSLGAAVEIAEEIAASATLYGIANGVRVCGRMLDDPELDPLWEVLERTRLPIVLHPHPGIGTPETDTYELAVGFPLQTTAALARLVLGGVLERFRGLRVVAAHGGGALPYLAARLDTFWGVDGALRARLPEPPSTYIRSLQLDAVLYGAPALRAAAAAVGTGALFFGTDHPFSIADADAALTAIAEAFGRAGAIQVRGMAAAASFGLPEVVRC